MTTIASLVAAIASIKNTTSGKVEFNNSTESLALIEALLQALLSERGVVQVADIAGLQALAGSESAFAFLPGAGLFMYELTNNGGYASVDGIGYWNRQLFISIGDLLDVDVSTPPTNGQALIWNSGQNKYVPANPTVSALSWVNITGKPGQIGADLGATDQLIKQFDVAGGTTQSIGIAARGNGNVTLTPMGDDLAAGTNSFVYAGQKIAHMTSAANSFLATTMTQFRSGSVPFTVVNCVIIGDPGALDGYFTGDVLQDVVAIGENGIPAFVKTAAGFIGLSGGASQNVEISGGLAVSVDTALTGDLDVTGDSTLGNVTIAGAAVLQSGADVTGPINASGFIRVGTYTTGTRPAFPTAGTMIFNSTLNKLEYYNGTTWVALP